MVDLVIELILIAAIIVPMIATSMQPAHVVSRSGSGVLCRFRRGK